MSAPYARPVVMGVVNVTPDSFSDGGEWFAPEAAIAHGLELLAQGADIVDVGGESTRPGAERPDEEEELRRVLPVVRALVDNGATVSIDTMRAPVARQAISAGASIINDVSAGLADPGMARLAAESRVTFVAMHWRGHSADMQDRAVYAEVVGDVCAALSARVADLTSQGVAAEDIVLDPGLGFAKNPEHNWELLRHLDQVLSLGHRVLVGASRKAFLGRVGRAAGHERPPLDRDVVTAATTLYAAMAGVWGIRVHHVPWSIDALDVAEALSRPGVES